MKLKIEIRMHNAAFANGNNGTEAARVLKDLATLIEDLHLEPKITAGDLRDTYGNLCGKWSVVKIK